MFLSWCRCEVPEATKPGLGYAAAHVYFGGRSRAVPESYRCNPQINHIGQWKGGSRRFFYENRVVTLSVSLQQGVDPPTEWAAYMMDIGIEKLAR